MMYIRGGSWAGYPVFLFVLCFSRSCYVVFMFYFCFGLCVLFCFRLVYLSFCIYNRTNTHNNKTTHVKQKHRYRNMNNNTNIKNKTEIHYFPAGTWEIFIRGRVEGWIYCISVVCVWYVCLAAFLFCFSFTFMFFLFYVLRLVY